MTLTKKRKRQYIVVKVYYADYDSVTLTKKRKRQYIIEWNIQCVPFLDSVTLEKTRKQQRQKPAIIDAAPNARFDDFEKEEKTTTTYRALPPASRCRDSMAWKEKRAGLRRYAGIRAWGCRSTRTQTIASQ